MSLEEKLNPALKKKQKKIISLRTCLVEEILRMDIWMKGAVGNYLNSFPGIPSLGSSYLIFVCSLGEGVFALHDTVCPQLKLWLPSETLQVGSGG